MSAPPKHARQLAHESISIETVEIGSNRSFGIVMAIACGTLSFFCWFKNIGHLPLILAVVSALFLVLAFSNITPSQCALDEIRTFTAPNHFPGSSSHPLLWGIHPDRTMDQTDRQRPAPAFKRPRFRHVLD